MENPLAIALRESRSPAELYGLSFRHFHTLFRSRPRADVSRVWLPSHLPDEAYLDPERLGWTITGALVAMVAHRLEGHTAELAMMISAETAQEIGVCLVSWQPELIARLDSIILVQGAICGDWLQDSDMVKMHVRKWARHDYRKYQRWLRALARAALVLHGKAKASLDDPFLYEVKQKAVEQLRPVVARMRKRFEEYRGAPRNHKEPEAFMREEMVKAFEEEALNPDVPFLNESCDRWVNFCREDPLMFLQLSPESLFDAFLAATTKHKLENGEAKYVRDKIYSLK